MTIRSAHVPLISRHVCFNHTKLDHTLEACGTLQRLVMALRIAVQPEFRHNGGMETVKIGKKGQVTIPRRVLEAAGLPTESQVIIESEADGSIRLRPAAVYPIDLYSADRVTEFERENQLPASVRDLAEQALHRRTRKN